MIELLHADPHNAHVVVDGNRYSADGTVVDSIAGMYVLQRVAGEWKFVLLSSPGDATGHS